MVGIQQMSQEQLTNVLSHLKKMIEGISEQIASSEYADNNELTRIAIDAMAGKFKIDSQSAQLIKTELKVGNDWLTEVGFRTSILHNNFEVPVKEVIKKIKFDFERNLRPVNTGLERAINLPEIDTTPFINVLFLCLVLAVTGTQTQD